MVVKGTRCDLKEQGVPGGNTTSTPPAGITPCRNVELFRCTLVDPVREREESEATSSSGLLSPFYQAGRIFALGEQLSLECLDGASGHDRCWFHCTYRTLV